MVEVDDELAVGTLLESLHRIMGVKDRIEREREREGALKLKASLTN